MTRSETTKFLSDLLIRDRLSGIGKYYASEVTLDWGQGKGKEKRIDFLQFSPESQLCVGDIEKGIFTCYEIKSCKEDVFSGNGLNFIGEKNYIVTTMECWIQNEIKAMNWLILSMIVQAKKRQTRKLRQHTSRLIK